MIKAEIRIDGSETIGEILEPSLESRGKVDLDVDSQDGEIKVTVETDSLGALRGTTDNVFRLSSLAKRIYEE